MKFDEVELARRFLRGPGLAQTSLSTVRSVMPKLRVFGTETLAFVAEVREPARAFHFLSTLSFPATRHVAFPVGKQNVAFVNNARNGHGEDSGTATDTWPGGRFRGFGWRERQTAKGDDHNQPRARINDGDPGFVSGNEFREKTGLPGVGIRIIPARGTRLRFRGMRLMAAGCVRAHELDLCECL